MLKKRYILVLIIILMNIGFISFSAVDYPIKSVKNSNESLIHSQDRVLIIAPHPDDESIGCAGVIRYCVENNISVKIVILTDGCLSGSAVTRHDESVAAMELLGVKEEDIIFLGYRDGTLPSLLNKNWESNNPYNINGTINNNNYSFSYQKNGTYSGEDLYNNLAEIMNNFQPTIIFYPDSEDEQIDHWASNAFIEYVTAKTNYNGTKYTYIVHDPPNWPSPRNYNPEANLNPPHELTKIGYKWVSFPLNQYQERLKEASFALYPSQIDNDSYVRSFIRQNELFGIIPVIPTNFSYSTLNFSSDNVSPETVIQEPVKKDLGKGSIRTREISSVGFQMDNEDAGISIETKHNISMSTWYEIHILFLDSPDFKRIDLKIYNGTAYYQDFSPNSYQSNDFNVQVENNEIKISIPSSAFNDTNSILMSADIISGNTLIDWTGWRTIDIMR